MPEKPTHQNARRLAELERIVRTAIENGEFDTFDDEEEFEYFDDDDPDDDPPDDFEAEAHRVLVDTLEQILITGTADPADDVVHRLVARASLPEYDVCPDDGPPLGEVVALSALVEFRHGPMPPDPRAVVGWVSDRLGAEAGRRAFRVAALLGHPDAPPWPDVDRGASGLPDVMLLLAGAVAVAGDTPVPY